jgi:hypothetical protein
MAAGAAVDGTPEEPTRGEARQAQALPAEVCLVGVTHVDCQPRHAVRASARNP